VRSVRAEVHFVANIRHKFRHWPNAGRAKDEATIILGAAPLNLDRRLRLYIAATARAPAKPIAPCQRCITNSMSAVRRSRMAMHGAPPGAHQGNYLSGFRRKGRNLSMK
jgi:hypothetical protein